MIGFPTEYALPAALGLLVLTTLWLAVRLYRLERNLPGIVAASVDDGLSAHEDARAVRDAQAQERLAARVDAASERLRASWERDQLTVRNALHQLHLGLQSQLGKQREDGAQRFAELGAATRTANEQLRSAILEQTLTTLSANARADRELLQQGIGAATTQLGASIESLTRTLDERLDAITGHVNQRLDEGFRKTNETFANVMARLATIDEAQKKIDGLTTNVVSLQELLGDKRARGAFGEVQLEALVRNALPPDAYAFQCVLPNNARVDCLLTLPEPTGRVAVDSKFPLENYHRMLSNEFGEAERRLAQNAFRADVRRHIDAIAAKYILADYTSEGAVMFVPAEAVFAEIHAHHPEVVTYALGKRVWIVSPTTLMAILNTARAVLKDVETRKQIHVIKDALGKLAKDFARFDERMNALARHIEQASKDVQDVQVSSRKITAHFQKIESAELDEFVGDARESDAREAELLRLGR